MALRRRWSDPGLNGVTLLRQACMTYGTVLKSDHAFQFTHVASRPASIPGDACGPRHVDTLGLPAWTLVAGVKVPVLVCL